MRPSTIALLSSRVRSFFFFGGGEGGGLVHCNLLFDNILLFVLYFLVIELNFFYVYLFLIAIYIAVCFSLYLRLYCWHYLAGSIIFVLFFFPLRPL